jgi:ABC-2 type transport system ATP-binding protein
MIKAQNVVKWFGPTLAVDDVSFEVKRGEVLGFLGPNGAGKSTTMRIITGYIPPSRGRVEIDGHDIERDDIAAKRLIGYLPENAPAYPEMSVAGFLGFVAEIRGLSGGAKRDAVERVIKTCFLERVRHQPIDTLSKGYRHRTCFAQSILHDPPVLVMDEPTDGLDPNQKHEVRQLIKSMGRNKAIVVSTHILEEVDAMCNRVIIIDRGRVVFNGGPDELRARSDVAGAVTVRLRERKGNEACTVLGALPQVARVAALGDGGAQVRVFPAADGRAPGALAAVVSDALRNRGWAFDELHTETGELDDVFRAITLSDTVDGAGTTAPGGAAKSEAAA